MARRTTNSRSKSRRSVRWWLARLLGGLAVVWAIGFFIFVLRQPGPAEEGLQTDGIAVLTGGPGRLARGADLLRGGGARRMLISGVDRKVRPAELRQATGLDRDLFECCVDLGFVADNTRTNASEVAEWVTRNGFKSVRLVTAGYHMPRARVEIAARLPADVRILADGVPARLSPLGLASEYSKLLASRFFLLIGMQGP